MADDGPVQRRLAAILAADVAGYSRMMGVDEVGTLTALKAIRRELIDPKIAEHRGRIVKTMGDGLLVEFASVVDAVRCSIEVNEAMAGLRLAPNNAHAHAILSVALHHLGMMRGGPTARDEVTRARDLALTAISLNEGDEYSHWALGNACNWLGDTDRAIAEFRRALELNPNYSLAYGMFGTALSVAGRPEESIAATEIAIRSNPRDPSNFFRYTSLAAAYFMLGNHEAVIEWASKAVEQKRDWFRAHHWLIASLAHSGRLEEARGAVKGYLEIFPNGSVRDADRYPLNVAIHKDNLIRGLKMVGLPE